MTTTVRPKPKPPLPPATKRAMIVDLRRLGYTEPAIGAALGLTKQRISKVLLREACGK